MGISLTFAQKHCVKKAGLALYKTASLSPGSRIGIAVSGGMDSLVLLKVMEIRRRILPFPIELIVLHSNPGFNKNNHAEMLNWLLDNGFSCHIEIGDYGILAHSSHNRKNSPCFLCSWERRKVLFSLCEKYNLTHLAFGHTANDLSSTFFMNLFRNGNVNTLPICETFFRGSLRVIRPLLLVEKKFIRQASIQWSLPVFDNPCPSAGKTARSCMEEIIREIDRKIPGAAKSALRALGRKALEKL